MPHQSPSRWRRVCVWFVTVGSLTVEALLLIIWMAVPASAAVQAAPLTAIIGRLQAVVTALLVGLATLFLTIAGVRYLFGAGDPGQIEKAKAGLRSAAIGYGIAALAGTLLGLLRYIVGA